MAPSKAMSTAQQIKKPVNKNKLIEAPFHHDKVISQKQRVQEELNQDANRDLQSDLHFNQTNGYNTT